MPAERLYDGPCRCAYPNTPVLPRAGKTKGDLSGRPVPLGTSRAGGLRRTSFNAIRHRDAERLAREIEQADLDAEKKRITEEEFEAARERQDDLKAQIERCQPLLDASRTWVGFESEPFRDALSCSLELLGANSLHERLDVFHAPRRDARAQLHRPGEGPRPSPAATALLRKRGRSRDQLRLAQIAGFR